MLKGSGGEVGVQLGVPVCVLGYEGIELGLLLGPGDGGVYEGMEVVANLAKLSIWVLSDMPLWLGVQ